MAQDNNFQNGEPLLDHRNRLNANATDAETRMSANASGISSNASAISAIIDDANNFPVRFGRVLYVDNAYAGATVDGSHKYPYKTIQAAVTQAGTLSPSESNKIMISIKPGGYTEDITMTGHIFLVSEALYAVTISGTISIDGVTNPGVQTCGLFGISVTSSDGTNRTLNIVGTNGDLRVKLRNCSILSTGTRGAILSDRVAAAGTQIEAVNTRIACAASTTDACVDIRGGQLHEFHFLDIKHEAFYAALRYTTGSVVLDKVTLQGSIEGINTSSSLNMKYCSCVAGPGSPCVSLSGPADISYTSLSSSAVNAIEGTNAAAVITLNAIDFPSSSGINTVGSFSLDNKLLAPNVLYTVGDSTDWPEGSPELTRTALDKLAKRTLQARTQQTMQIQTNTNLDLGTWDDITSALSDDADSVSQALFPTGALDECLYIGADFAYTAMGYSISAGMDSDNSLELEYWNGVGWSPARKMQTVVSPVKVSTGGNVMSGTGPFHLRHSEPQDWAQNTLNGSLKYWMRLRIVTPTASIPTADLPFYILSSGVFSGELFGNLMSFGFIDIMRFKDVVGFTLVNASILAGPLTGLQKQNNSLNGNAQDLLGWVLELPLDIDTSKDMTASLTYNPDSNGSGDVEFLFSSCIVSLGDVADGTLPEETTSVIVTFPGAEDNVVKRESVSFDNLEDTVTGDTLQMSVGRDATGGNINDTYPGIVVVRAVKIAYTKWRI